MKEISYHRNFNTSIDFSGFAVSITFWTPETIVYSGHHLSNSKEALNFNIKYSRFHFYAHVLEIFESSTYLMHVKNGVVVYVLLRVEIFYTKVLIPKKNVTVFCNYIWM